jgi:CelD/BcsL family acetyltransferase involved in cellulose biosynthesis
VRAQYRFDVLAPQALGAAERAAWRGFVAASPRLRSPYFDLRYTLAAAEETPDARVAVIHDGGDIAGFLPFQRRGPVIQPLGAPLTDYHGVISSPDRQIPLRAVVGAVKARLFRFNALKDPLACPRARRAARHAMSADLAGGYAAYAARQAAGHPRFFKKLGRHARALAREHGPLTFEFNADDPATVDMILERKRRQLRRTGAHDIFACGWTERLVRRLLAHQDRDFGARLAVLRAGDKVVSAEIGLRGGATYHLWFPVYDPAFARFAPGMQMTLRTLEAAAADGIGCVDFGLDDQPYKTYFAEPADLVVEGRVIEPGWRAACSDIADRVLGAGPAGLTRLRDRLRRRLDVIDACETDLPRWLGGAATALGSARTRGIAPQS